MCDPEVFSAIADWIALSHSYGEETWSNLQWWISGSFAVILTSHFARTSLNIFTAVLLGLLYALFTWMVGTNMAHDRAKDGRVHADLTHFAQSHGCGDLEHLVPYEAGVDIAFTVFLPVMFFSTLGYLAYSCWAHMKSAA